MKSVAIIDTPDKCIECSLNKCPAWADIGTRPDDCPLKPLPPREVQNIYSFEGYENGRAAGFNYCLDLIGGTE